MYISTPKTDLKTVIIKKNHNSKDEETTIFTLHKEFHDLDKVDKIKFLEGLIIYVTDELGKIRYKKDKL
ncbi:MAG: hypothetical protein GY928_02165 [Colwellia sp.]|nr:hypothetical protein [Colwellia sp.]